ncbi:arylamine N-acetyltransferase [Mycolicibacterium stellerae]|uniref:arylamine N-acetyltransferase n=1 Tax=Mycolicibacterium stellerae TaxID=2358193 RepID=UPI001F265DCC|nr:arylamine N-acetyltransferase [Mycolicibacterium stellerae]
MTADSIADYFYRVSYTGPTGPTSDALAALVTAPNRSLPFENLDPVMGIPVVDLRPDALFDKLVRRRHGGYCFEQNGVMAHVLSQLGFGVDVLGGRGLDEQQRRTARTDAAGNRSTCSAPDHSR